MMTATILVAVGSVAIYQQSTSAAPQPASRPIRDAPYSTPTRPQPSPSPSASPTRPIQVIRLAAPILEADTGWEIVGFGPEGLVRIDPHEGVVTRTSLSMTRHPYAVIISTGRNFTAITFNESGGYLVPDGSRPRRLQGLLADAALAAPAPDPDHLWAITRPTSQPSDEQVQIRLVDQRGRPTGQRLPVPHSSYGFGLADGRGYLVLDGIGGTYEAQPDGLHRVTSGTLLAAGPTRWLTTDCDDHGACHLNVVDRRDGARHQLAGSHPELFQAPGVISPDGRYASILVAGAGAARVMIFDLATGRRQLINAPLYPTVQQFQAWTPDSHLLLVADGQGTLYAVDPATGEARKIEASLPPIHALVIRSTLSRP